MPINEMKAGAERRHIHFDAQAHPDVRESHAFLVPLPHLGLGVIFYTWVHAFGPDGAARAGAAGIAFGPALESTIFEVHDDIAVPDSLQFEDWTVGPARMTLSDDMMRASIHFAGSDIEIDYEWDGITPSFGFAANRNGCPQWLAWDRTEQAGRVRGSIRLGDVTHPLDGYGHRDHSWGMRDWGGATHWKWWNLMVDDETAIHVMELQGFGKTTVHGYVQKDGEIATVLSLDADLAFDDRFVHTEITAELTDDAGRTTQILCRQGADLQWPVSPRLWIHEAAMHVEIDGRPGVGYIECAWPPEYVAHHRRDDGPDAASSALTLDRD